MRSWMSRMSLACMGVVAAMLGACSPVTLLNALVSRDGFSVSRGVAYGAGPRRMVDIYRPAKRASADAAALETDKVAEPRRPVVVFLYGGSWQGGARLDYLFVGAALASHGFVVVVPDYRVYPEVVFPAFVEDAAAAVRWTYDHAAEFGGDPKRLFIVGHSAGAQIAVLLVTDGRYLAAQHLGKRAVKGVVGLAGPYDFLPLADPTLERIFPRDSRRDSQPVNFVTGDEPPMLLACGTADRVVDPGNTDRMAVRLRALGDQVEVRHYSAVGHAMLIGAMAAPLRGVAPVLEDAVAFLDGLDRESGVHPADSWQ